MRPSKMMQQIAGFYGKEYPQHFRQEPPKDVLEVEAPETAAHMVVLTFITSQPCSFLHI